jgi:hypothetical protein
MKKQTVVKIEKTKVKRPNVHAKSKSSKLKSSKLYKKSTKDKVDKIFCLYLGHLVYASINHDSARLTKLARMGSYQSQTSPKANEG